MKSNKNASIKDVKLAENVIKVTFGKAGAINEFFEIDCCSCGARFSGKIAAETLVTDMNGMRMVEYKGRISRYAKIFKFGKTTATMFSICGNCGRYHKFADVKTYKEFEKAVFDLDSERKKRDAAKAKKSAKNAVVSGKIEK